MLKIDNNLLISIGLGDLPVEEKNKLLAQIYETLELRVGMTLAAQMSEEQLTEFESYIDGNDESGALGWLESNFPNYKDVVAAELDKLKEEIKQQAPQIAAAVQAGQSAVASEADGAPAQPAQAEAPQTDQQIDQNAA